MALGLYGPRPRVLTVTNTDGHTVTGSVAAIVLCSNLVHWNSTVDPKFIILRILISLNILNRIGGSNGSF